MMKTSFANPDALAVQVAEKIQCPDNSHPTVSCPIFRNLRESSFDTLQSVVRQGRKEFLSKCSWRCIPIPTPSVRPIPTGKPIITIRPPYPTKPIVTSKPPYPTISRPVPTGPICLQVICPKNSIQVTGANGCPICRFQW
ncbi:hypothetical protein HY468_05205 [Candidatus Roizmanbacteria bacterium]|nr:hypothetical protein [Candidatus Roizmanbacteria bacterium]